MKDVDPRVFTRIVTDGWKDGRTDGSVTISPRNFVGEGIIMTEGSDNLSVDINHKLFECVFQFIKSTKRFSH